MCTYPVQPICTFSCTSVFFINIYYPQYTVLHILSHCTSYSFYFIICSLFHSHLYLYIYSLVLCLFIYFFCTFHWADLSCPTFHYWLYPVWLCMWQIIKNLEPIPSVRINKNIWDTFYYSILSVEAHIINYKKGGVRYDDFWSWTIKISPQSAFEEIS